MPEPIGDPLRQPALHPARRHGDDLGRERVGRRVGQQGGDAVDEAVRAVGSVEVQHRGHDMPSRGSSGSVGVTAPGTAFEGEVLIRRLRWSSDETGFAVIDAEAGGDELVLIGLIAHLEERERVRVAGVWQDDRRYGPQVQGRDRRAGPAVRRRRADGLPPARPPRRAGARRRSCWTATATACSRRSTAIRTPRSAGRGSIPRARPRRSARGTACAPAARSTSCSRRTGSPGSCRGSPSSYGDRAHQVVREHPYELTSVFGVGFQTADTIARAAGVGAGAPPGRARGVVHVLAEAEKNGSTCLPVGRARRARRDAAGRRRRRRGAAAGAWRRTAISCSRPTTAARSGPTGRRRRRWRPSWRSRSASWPAASRG